VIILKKLVVVFNSKGGMKVGDSFLCKKDYKVYTIREARKLKLEKLSRI
jgi:hypothetical protein